MCVAGRFVGIRSRGWGCGCSCVTVGGWIDKLYGSSRGTSLGRQMVDGAREVV